MSKQRGFTKFLGFLKRVSLPRGPNDQKTFNLARNFQSGSKFSISLEIFNLDVSNYPQKIGPRWMARSKISISLENFNLARNFQSRSKSRIFFDLWALWVLNLRVRANSMAWLFLWKQPRKSLEVRFDFGLRPGFSKQLFVAAVRRHQIGLDVL